ncbi:unnamed protein product [Symbiodinium sp. CCMP2456]|nr:unnamed protein product [Symbiodinium sp. CCMP2456]
MTNMSEAGQTGTCDPTLSIAQQIPAVQCSCAMPMKKVDMSYCSRVCAKGEASTQFRNTVLKGIAGTATTPDAVGGIIKAVFYAGLHLSGTIPDWNEHTVCLSTFDFIMRKCARGFKCMPHDMDRSWRCHGVWDSLNNPGDSYVCKVVEWWDACCPTRDPPARDEQDCAGCGQDQYFCGCSEIGDGVRPTH